MCSNLSTDLLQRILIDYYAPMYTDEWGARSFNKAALWMKFVTVIIVLSICWVIQSVFQDFLVAKLYGYVISYRKKVRL